jgi:hypothetical protein
VTGDKKLQSEGKFDKAKGSAHNLAGDVKDAARDASKTADINTDHRSRLIPIRVSGIIHGDAEITARRDASVGDQVARHSTARGTAAAASSIPSRE